MPLHDTPNSQNLPAGIASTATMGLTTEGSAMLRQIWSSLDLPAGELDHLQVLGEGDLQSVYAISDLAVASIGAAALSVKSLLSRNHGSMRGVQVNRALAARWFSQSIQPVNWLLPPTWDDVAGDYQTRDGWIKLHTNAPKHRAAALLALGFDAKDESVDKRRVTAAVREAIATDLETAVVGQGGCAAEMRTAAAWSVHPQGQAVAKEPLLHRQIGTSQIRADWDLDIHKPLRGIRVLDLTRILAGPIATRFLAGYGADVLRIDPLDWDEPVVAPEVTLGKKRARLDLRSSHGLATFERLLAQADVLVHGYRADALERLGLGVERRHELNPGLVDVSLNAYGWTGPWRNRRGFDSLIQMSSGIAEAGMRLLGKPQPTPLPVQGLDHATGYILAAAVIRGLIRRIDDGRGSRTQGSLARTAAMFTDCTTAQLRQCTALPSELPSDYSPETEHTPWGPAKRLLPAYNVAGSPVIWTRPAGNLGDGLPSW